MKWMIPGAPRDRMPGVAFSGDDDGGTVTQVRNAEPWAPQAGKLTYGFDQAQALYGQGRLAGNPYPGKTYADMSPTTQRALDMTAQRALGGSAVTDAGKAELTKTLGGQYLSAGNPHMGAMMDSIEAEVTPRVDARFAASGRTGSGMHARATADALTDAGSKLAYQNYSDERQNMMRGMLFAPEFAAADYRDLAALQGVGGAYEGFAQKEINDAVQRFNIQQNTSMEGLKNYMGLISGNYGGTTTGTQTGGGQSAAGSALGGAMAGAGVGNMIYGGGYGAGIGAAAGGLLGLLG